MKLNATKSSIVLDIILTIITLGLWNFYVQMRQIWDVNEMLPNEEPIPSVVLVLIFSLLTFGLYFCYHEYKLTKKLHMLQYGVANPTLEIGAGILAFFGLWFVVDSYQQNLINEYLEVGPIYNPTLVE
jgi:hypothetical protein